MSATSCRLAGSVGRARALPPESSASESSTPVSSTVKPFTVAMSSRYPCTARRGGSPPARRIASTRSEKRSAFGPIGMRPIEIRTRYGCRRLTRRCARAMSFSCSCHRGGSGSGICSSPISSSNTRSSRPSLLPTCQYRDAAPVPSSSASRRMLSAARPSRSSRPMAAVTMASRLIGSRRRLPGRLGSRCQGGGATCGSAGDGPELASFVAMPSRFAAISASASSAGRDPGPLEHCTSIEHRLTRTLNYVRTLFVKRISFEGVEMTSIQAAVTGRPAAPAGYPRRWLAAIIMIVGALMDMIDVTIVNVALPTIRRDLHASATQLEWVVSGYMLAFAAALIIAGNLGDLLGRKRVFLLGAGLFGLASLWAGLSVTGPELIAARVVQGAAAAAMAPQVLATFRAIFAAGERGKAFGIYGAMLGFASAVGLVLGGVL